MFCFLNIYLIGKKLSALKLVGKKFLLAKHLFTCPKFGHFLPTIFLSIRYFNDRQLF